MPMSRSQCCDVCIHSGSLIAPIGGLILLMLWLYWSGVALLVGAEIDSAIEQAGAEHATESESGTAPMATLPRDA